jgi:hypothetical protein
MTDRGTCKTYAEEIKQFPANGVKLITFRRAATAIKKRGLENADILLDVLFCGDPLVFQRGVINDCMFSGLYCVQFAIEQGAQRLLLPGFEGYKPNCLYPHWDDVPYAEQAGEIRYNEGFFRPWWKLVANACPDVEFIFYGDMNYQVEGSNVTVMESVACP